MMLLYVDRKRLPGPNIHEKFNLKQGKPMRPLRSFSNMSFLCKIMGDEEKERKKPKTAFSCVGYDGCYFLLRVGKV
jgi:hypothetical protein